MHSFHRLLVWNSCLHSRSHWLISLELESAGGTPLNEAWSHLRAPGLAKAYWKLSEDPDMAVFLSHSDAAMGRRKDVSVGTVETRDHVDSDLSEFIQGFCRRFACMVLQAGDWTPAPLQHWYVRVSFSWEGTAGYAVSERDEWSISPLNIWEIEGRDVDRCPQVHVCRRKCLDVRLMSHG